MDGVNEDPPRGFHDGDPYDGVPDIAAEFEQRLERRIRFSEMPFVSKCRNVDCRRLIDEPGYCDDCFWDIRNGNLIVD